MSLELDGLPVGVLRALIQSKVQARMDLAALQAVQRQEESDRRQLVEALKLVG